MIPIDKLLHFMVGYCVASTLMMSPVAAIICVIIVAVAKEGYDYISTKYLQANHEVSAIDFFVTVAGGVAGLGLQFLATYFFTHFPQLLGL